MVQRTNAACGGRESVGVMKGEVVRSIRTGSTIARRPSDGAALFVCGVISPFTAEGRSLVFDSAAAPSPGSRASCTGEETSLI